MLSYTLDPSLFTLLRFQELTRSRKMLPSRLILHEELDERFALLSISGIESLADLLRMLGTKEKIENFSSHAGLDSQYLNLLKREAASYLARPFPLSDFPGIPFEYTEILKSKGIRNTKDYFENVQTEMQRKDMAGQTGIPEARLRELYVLCDFSRITGVGGSMARMVYEAGIRSTREFATGDERFADQLSEDDISYCIAYATVITEMEMGNL